MLGKTAGNLVATALSPDPVYFVNGVSPAMRAVERVIAEIAPTDIPVLLVGESGTGKEVVALEIHRRSKRCTEIFLKCNCASTELDALLFDQSRGANGHTREHATAIGTLFLDDIDQLGLTQRTRLLQLLPDGDRLPSGKHLGARLISATTRNLEEEMRIGHFPQQLYYRINGVYLRLPSLRHRKEDIPALLAFFLKKYASLFNRRSPQLGSQATDLLLQHAWPGNVRELENVARKIVALGDEQLALSDLMVSAAVESTPPAPEPGRTQPNHQSLKHASREASRKAERELILKALDRTHWNRKRTARELQISYKALLYKLKQLNLGETSNL